MNNARKKVVLNDITSKIGSGATPTGGSNSYQNHGISLIRSQNVLDLNFSKDGLAFLDDNQARLLNNVEVQENDILLNITGDSVARACKVPKEILPARVNQHVSILRAKNDKLEPDYLLYHLIAQKEELLSLSEIGATRRALTKGMLENLTISLPPLPEQKAIASILSSLDDKIDLLHRQNATLEKMAETLFRQWFIENQNEPVELCEYAWNIRQTAKVSDFANHQHYVGLEHIPRRSISITEWGKPEGLGSNKSTFKENDILFGKLRSYFHKVVFAPVSGICSTDILVIRAKNPKWFPFCLFWFSNSDVVEFSDLGAGGTRMPRTNWEIISKYKVPRPRIEEIEKFDVIASPMIAKIKSNQTQIRTLAALRDALLPKLMTAEARLAPILI